MATVAITNGHNVVVAVSFETAANPVHIYSRISYVFLLCTVFSAVLLFCIREKTDQNVTLGQLHVIALANRGNNTHTLPVHCCITRFS